VMPFLGALPCSFLGGAMSRPGQASRDEGRKSGRASAERKVRRRLMIRLRYILIAWSGVGKIVKMVEGRLRECDVLREGRRRFFLCRTRNFEFRCYRLESLVGSLENKFLINSTIPTALSCIKPHRNPHVEQVA